MKDLGKSLGTATGAFGAVATGVATLHLSLSVIIVLCVTYVLTVVIMCGASIVNSFTTNGVVTRAQERHYEKQDREAPHYVKPKRSQKKDRCD